MKGKVALITGGDSGIGRAVAVLYAREGADVAIGYLPPETEDAEVTKREVTAAGQRCELIPGDLVEASYCERLVEETVERFGHLDILVSNAARQNCKPTLSDVCDEEFDRTFKLNVFA